MVAPFQIPGLPTYPTSFPYPPSLAQPFMVGGTTSPFPSSILGLHDPASQLAHSPRWGQGLMSSEELAGRVANIQSMVTPGSPPGSVVAPNLLQRLSTPLLRTAENPGLWRQTAGLAGKAGLLGKGLGYGVAGELGSLVAQKALPGSSTTEHVLSGAAKGAGIGAGIGAIGLPIPIVGEVTTGGGALLGGAIGGLAGLLTGGKKKGPQPINLAHLYQQANIDPQTAAQFDRYYRVLTSLDGSKEGRLQARSTIANLVLQKVAQQQANPVHTLTPSEMAAMQAQTAQFLKPYTDQTLSTAQQAYQNTMGQLSNVPEQYRGVLSSGASNQLSAATRLANAYAAQAQLAPQAMALQQQQQTQQALAQQLLQQAIAAQLSGQSAGGGVDLSQLIGASG